MTKTIKVGKGGVYIGGNNDNDIEVEDGGIVIKGKNTGILNTGSSTVINTGGLPYIGGNITVGGDFVNGSVVVINDQKNFIEEYDLGGYHIFVRNKKNIRVDGKFAGVFEGITSISLNENGNLVVEHANGTAVLEV